MSLPVLHTHKFAAFDTPAKEVRSAVSTVTEFICDETHRFSRCYCVLWLNESQSKSVTFSVSLSTSLTNGPVGRVLLHFAFPVFCTNVLQSLNGSVNAFWVGRYLGETALSAVINANSVMLLMSGVSLGIASAATILVGQCIGAGNIPQAKRVASTGAIFFFVLSIVMSGVGVVLAEPILRAMHTTPTALPLAVAYIKVLFIASPSMYMYAFVMSLLVGSGDSKTPLRFMMLFVGIGTILDPLFMFGLGPIPGAGVAGSALASLVAQTISLVALVSYLYRRGYQLCLYRQDLAPLRMDHSIVGTLLRKGIPIGAQVLVFALSSMPMIVLVNRFGDAATAAFGASTQLWIYIQMPGIAISIAVSAMTAQNVGIQSWDRVRLVARIGVLYGVLLTSAFIALVYACDGYAYRLFLPEGSEAIPIASHINRIVLWSLVLFNISVVGFGVIRGYGAVIAPLVVYGISLIVVRFSVATSLINMWQADALWWSFPISHAVAFILAALYYRYGNWRAMHRQLFVPSLPVPQHREEGRQPPSNCEGRR